MYEIKVGFMSLRRQRSRSVYLCIEENRKSHTHMAVVYTVRRAKEWSDHVHLINYSHTQ